MPTYFQRPENALKRAKEFIDVNKKQRALDVLYDVIKSKRHRQWQKSHEPILRTYVDLCVELRKSHIAKEGLFQYRNICQQMNIKSLEDVVRHYLALAEEKTEEARKESQQAVIDIDDLDMMQTPESLLLSAVSGEDVQDRTDRVLLTPWVKFLWESYRQCLELLRNNSRVERLYHDIAQQAFKFCLNYNRKTEFRKLCDNLRTHLGHIHKYQNQQTAVNLNNPESQAMHLETRLCQLDSAIQMELWQEAYKAIEDIHGLMTLPKKAPKPQLLAIYYQKLALVFWKAGNYLFHSSAVYRLYTLCKEQKKSITADEMNRLASRVLLATLSVPIHPPQLTIDRFLESDENQMEKQRRLATLLGLPNPPTRVSLIKDMLRMDILSKVPKELQELYQWLEVEFHPLHLCSRLQTVFDSLCSGNEDDDTRQYMSPLQDNALVRLLRQVAEVYQTIEVSRLLQLAPFATQYQLERVIVDAARYHDLQVRLDHRTSTLRFGLELNVSQQDESADGFGSGPHLQPMPSERMRTQLVSVSSMLAKAIRVTQAGKLAAEREGLQANIVKAYHATAPAQHAHILQRQHLIEERKEALEKMNQQREEEEKRLADEHRSQQLRIEEERLRVEEEQRVLMRKRREHEEISKQHVRTRIEEMMRTGIGAKILKELPEDELEKMNAEEIMARQMEQLDRERKELIQKLRAQEKKIDYLERAKRVEEIPLIQKAHEEKKTHDREFWEQQEQERIQDLLAERQVSLQHRQRLERIVQDKDEFLEKLMESRHQLHEEKMAAFKEKLGAERKKRLAELREKRKEERRQRFYRQKAEEAARKKEEEEQQKAEEVARAKETLRLEQEAERERVAAKQQAREKEIEEKQRQRDEELRRQKEPESEKKKPGLDSWRQRGDDRDKEPERNSEKVAPWRPSHRGSERWKEDRDAPIRRDDRDAPIRRDDRDAPIHRDDRDAPIRHDDRDAPIRREERDAPISREDGDVPVRREEREAPLRRDDQDRDAPARREERDAPVRREDRDTPFRREERDGPIRRDDRDRDAPIRKEERDNRFDWSRVREERPPPSADDEPPRLGRDNRDERRDRDDDRRRNDWRQDDKDRDGERRRRDEEFRRDEDHGSGLRRAGGGTSDYDRDRHDYDRNRRGDAAVSSRPLARGGWRERDEHELDRDRPPLRSTRDSDRDRPMTRDRDTDHDRPRDFDRNREFDRGPRDAERDRTRNFDRPRDTDRDRGARDFDRDRGGPRDLGLRDRPQLRDDRPLGPRDSDRDRASARDLPPLRDRQRDTSPRYSAPRRDGPRRDAARPPPRDGGDWRRTDEPPKRGLAREDDRGGNWRESTQRDDRKAPPRSAPRTTKEPPKNEPDAEGWTQVRR